VSPDFFSAIASGAAVVTPNRRLARFLHQQYDRAQHLAGRHAWPTASILPYSAWLRYLWDEAIAAGVTGGRALLLDTAQSAWLWRNIVEAGSTILLDARGAARLAAEAWTALHAWGESGARWRAWQRGEDDRDDAVVFASWAESYLGDLRRLDAIDSARLADVLSPMAARVPAWRRETIFAGFIEFSPQQQRLRAALSAAGIVWRDVDSVQAIPVQAIRIAARSAREELIAALSWARRHAAADSSDGVGIVVEDLAQRREQVLALADDILGPALAPSDALSRPFQISLGLPLADIPLVRTALDLIALGALRAESGLVAAALRSPYLLDAERSWKRRAAIERDWLEEGRRDVSMSDAVAALERRSPELAARWREGREALLRARPSTPREWVDAWRAWLAAAGWPGSRSLDSAEYQARQAWEKLLNEFAALGAVAPRCSNATAIDRLRELARVTVFQPEGAAAPIQILGVLEGSGLGFAALWVAGMSAERWPPAPAPNPLLPLRWQRERNVPRSSAQRELEFARTITARFASAAPTVVFSSPVRDGDRPLSVSSLILAYPEHPTGANAQGWVQLVQGSATLETIRDDRAPAIAPGTVAPGGSRLVQSQSDCPFQAMARHRLRAQPWPAPLAGLSAQERGLIMHATLASFWESVRDLASLVALDGDMLDAHIDRAVRQGISQLPSVRWRSLPEVVRAGEAVRVATVLDAWLAVERARPAFSVSGVEAKTVLRLSGITLDVRLDRVDALADGGWAIVDYKTGRADGPRQWFEPRPRSAQLGLYTLAQRDATPDVPVRAIAYAELCPDEVRALGVAADTAAWPGLKELAEVGAVEDWNALEAWWRTSLGALATEIAEGRANVTPRATHPIPCRTCRLQPLCRIQSTRFLDALGDDASE